MRHLRRSSGLFGLGALMVVAVALAPSTHHHLDPSHLARLSVGDSHNAVISAAEARATGSLASLGSLTASALIVLAAWILLGPAAAPATARTDRRQARWWARLVGAPPVSA